MSVKALMLENGVKAIYRVTGEIASAFKRTSTRLWHYANGTFPHTHSHPKL